MPELHLHLAPNAPWLPLLLLSVALAALGVWAYRFRIPPLGVLARRALPLLRALALVALAWLLAQPVLERARAGRGAQVVVLLDRSASMGLPDGPGDATTRAARAAHAVEALRDAWRGRARITVMPFAARLASDTLPAGADGATALGTALTQLAASPEGQQLDGAVVVSDGVVNAGEDPATAARALGVPVHAVAIGRPGLVDRSVAEVEASERARVGVPTPVRVHVRSSEPRGAPLTVHLAEDGHELGRVTVSAPGPGRESVAEIRALPFKPGLAVWTAAVDPLPGETLVDNDAREVALEVAPGRIGVLVLSAGLNWDLTFLRRALVGDSSLALTTRVREGGAWRDLETARPAAPPMGAELRACSVVVLDGLMPGDAGPEFDRAVDAFVHAGGGLLVLGGPPPGLTRTRLGVTGRDLAIAPEPSAGVGSGAPVPTADGRELTQWDDDPARGDRAWRGAAPLTERVAFRPGGGDRVLIATEGSPSPVMSARRIGRGQALYVNGTGFWRWSLSGTDELSADRGRLLWRRLVRWLAEPVQGEPLRVRPERWVTPGGETVRLFASLQDDAFRPIAGATLEGSARDAAGHTRTLAFTPAGAGSYVVSLDDLPPGRWSVSARATRAGRELGRATGEFAVDRWSLETAEADPDSSTLAAMTRASGGRIGDAAGVSRWARTLPDAALARVPSQSVRLWESPWVLGAIVTALSIEWAWRRRRGLP
ncbi:MAG: hypothetical protein ACHQ52_08310 [Candidatus Eisenbacteria bacterium]